MSHLLVTNDFPPKVGGIQNYLFELWRRLPPEQVTVFTTPYEGAHEFDQGLSFRIERSKSRVLLPTPRLVSGIRALASEVSAGLVVFDPAFPLALAGPRLGLGYAVILHGAETAIPGRLPLSGRELARVISSARLVIAAGGYSEAEARRLVNGRLPPVVQVPPGVDVERFHPLSRSEREKAREELGLPVGAPLVVSVSRLVPRKGMDVLIEAVGLLRASIPDICLAIAGGGRDLKRLKGIARRAGVEVRWLGRISDDEKARLDGTADVWAMLCRDRWLGLEQEGFGIVFLEAAATGVPQVAGLSGGSHEAVADGETGYVLRNPSDPARAAAAIRKLLENDALRARLGEAARRRAVAEFDYAILASRLHDALVKAGG